MKLEEESNIPHRKVITPKLLNSQALKILNSPDRFDTTPQLVFQLSNQVRPVLILNAPCRENDHCCFTTPPSTIDIRYCLAINNLRTCLKAPQGQVSKQISRPCRSRDIHGAGSMSGAERCQVLVYPCRSASMATRCPRSAGSTTFGGCKPAFAGIRREGTLSFGVEYSLAYDSRSRQ